MKPPPGNEIALQGRIMKALKRTFPEFVVLRMNAGRVFSKGGVVQLAPKGFPDLLVLSTSGVAIGMEVKVEGEEPSANQVIWLHWFYTNKFPCAVVRSEQQALDFAGAYR